MFLTLVLRWLLLCSAHFHAMMAVLLSLVHISASRSLSVCSSIFTFAMPVGTTPTLTRL